MAPAVFSTMEKIFNSTAVETDDGIIPDFETGIEGAAPMTSLLLDLAQNSITAADARWTLSWPQTVLTGSV